MDKQMEHEDLFDIDSSPKDKDKGFEVGTEILDPSMPSQLIQQMPPPKRNSPKKPAEIVLPPAKAATLGEIQNYRVTGKSMWKIDPRYMKDQTLARIILPTITVKRKSENSGGIKGIWESIVGYSKREIYMAEGFLYDLEQIKDGYYVRELWSLEDLFKVFNDKEENRIRLVFTKGVTTVAEDFFTKDRETFLRALSNQLKLIGRSI